MPTRRPWHEWARPMWTVAGAAEKTLASMLAAAAAPTQAGREEASMAVAAGQQTRQWTSLIERRDWRPLPAHQQRVAAAAWLSGQRHLQEAAAALARLVVALHPRWAV